MPFQLATATPAEIRQFVRYGIKSLTLDPLFYYAAKQYKLRPSYEKAVMLYSVFFGDLNPEFDSCEINISDDMKRSLRNPAFGRDFRPDYFDGVTRSLLPSLNQYVVQYNGPSGGAPKEFTLKPCYLAAKSALSRVGFDVGALGM